MQPQGNPQSSTGKIITQQRAETLAQAAEDKLLLDRLFPQIIKRIDGATLLQKIDAKTFAAKVLPWLDLKVTHRERLGEERRVTHTGPDPTPANVGAKAYCVPEETIIGGGFITGGGKKHSSTKIINPDGWEVGASMQYGQLWAYAECLKVELALKQVEQPQAIPTPPPGRPPVQPP